MIELRPYQQDLQQQVQTALAADTHHAAAGYWERAMKQWPGRIIGMTATPWRLSKKRGLTCPTHPVS